MSNFRGEKQKLVERWILLSGSVEFELLPRTFEVVFKGEEWKWNY